jgi:hypothetical protein
VGECDHNNLPELLGKTLYKNLCPEFLSHFQELQEDSLMMLTSS